MFYDRRQRKPSVTACLGGLLAGAAIGLAAYAAHGPLDALGQSRLESAALYAFGHGIALTALAAGTTRRLGRTGLYLLLVGTLLFSGSLALNVLANVPSQFAPFGGIALMLGWLLWAIDAIRR